MTTSRSGDDAIESSQGAPDEPNDRAAASALADARRTAEALVREAERESNESRLEAARLLEDARSQARALLDESRIQRENALRALSEKRQQARSELAELRAGIEDLRRMHAEMARIVAEAGQILHSDGPVSDVMADAPGDPAASSEAVHAAEGPQSGEAVGAPVIDLQARRQQAEVAQADAGHESIDAGGADEDDPALEIDAAAEQRRLADREEAFAAAAPAARETSAAPEGAVPLVSRRERQDIDQLFAQVVDARQQIDAQAQETLRTVGPAVDLVEESDDPDTAWIQRRDRAVTTHGPDAALVLKRVLADQLNEVLDGLRRVGAKSATVEGLLPENRDSEYADAIAPSLAAAAEIGAGRAVDVTDVGAEAASDLGGWLRRRISAFLAEPDRLEQRLRRLFREARRDRADLVATHAVARAFGFGVLADLAEDDQVRWMSPVECTEACADNVRSSPRAVGSPFPSGHLLAPGEHGCRCLVVPLHQ